MTTRPCPFTILVDSAEQHPWTFQNIRCDSPHSDKTWEVTTRWQSLGRHPNGLGDYSIEGCELECHVERKSVEDLIGTLVGWPVRDKDTGEYIEGSGRRERFEKELSNLNETVCSAVIVEGQMMDVLQAVRDWGGKKVPVQRKIINRSVIAYQQDYPSVRWLWCPGRRAAEVQCFQWFRRYWRKNAR